MTFVVDASVTLAWVFIDERTEFTNEILDRLHRTTAVVPVIWPLEIANVLINSERRGRIKRQETDEFLQFFSDLPIAVDDEAVRSTPGPIITIAREHNLSSYDASYLELAVRRGLPLAALDARLLAAASQLGVPTFSE